MGQHKDARGKALRAARLAIEENISMSEAAERIGSKRSSVQEAFTVLTLGTAEEIAALESGVSSMGPLVDSIIARTPPEARRAAQRNPHRGPINRENRQFDADVWNRLRDALDNLTAMPIPTDVVRIVKKNNMRAESVSRKLLTAHTWLEDFINAWTAG